MFQKLFISAAVLISGSIAFSGQNIATNSNGCKEIIITGNSVQSFTMNGQTISNSQSTSLQPQVVSEPDIVAALEAQIKSKMRLFEQKKAQYDVKLAEFKASASKSARAARSLTQQSNSLKALEIQIDNLTEQYDALTSNP
jgi:predicted RNase H-like nuclease (RuvC/YqgF family)